MGLVGLFANVKGKEMMVRLKRPSTHKPVAIAIAGISQGFKTLGSLLTTWGLSADGKQQTNLNPDTSGFYNATKNIWHAITRFPQDTSMVQFLDTAHFHARFAELLGNLFSLMLLLYFIGRGLRLRDMVTTAALIFGTGVLCYLIPRLASFTLINRLFDKSLDVNLVKMAYAKLFQAANAGTDLCQNYRSGISPAAGSFLGSVTYVVPIFAESLTYVVTNKISSENFAGFFCAFLNILLLAQLLIYWTTK